MHSFVPIRTDEFERNGIKAVNKQVVDKRTRQTIDPTEWLIVKRRTAEEVSHMRYCKIKKKIGEAVSTHVETFTIKYGRAGVMGRHTRTRG